MVLKLWFRLATRWPFYEGKHFTAVRLSNYFHWLPTLGLATESKTEARRRNSTIWSCLSASCSRRLRPHHRGKTGSHVLGELVLFLWLLLTTLCGIYFQSVPKSLLEVYFCLLGWYLCWTYFEGPVCCTSGRPGRPRWPTGRFEVLPLTCRLIWPRRS